jgi:S-adenosylmethionine hydrolase
MALTTVTLLSDVGTRSELPGVLASIVRDIAPDAVVVHLSHDIDPHDVRAGSLALARAMGYVASGVMVAAVDPATDRPSIAVMVAGGAGILIGPDNGLLAPAVAMAGGAERAMLLTNDDLHLLSPGSLLIVRDVLVPVAAHLCAGVPFDLLGTEVDPGTLLPGVVPISRIDNAVLSAEVLWVDRFGNVQLNIGPDEIAEFGERVSLRFDGQTRTAVSVPTVIGLNDSQVALVPDPYGLVAVSLCRRSAAEELGLDVGTGVELSAAGTDRGVDTPVQLRR